MRVLEVGNFSYNFTIGISRSDSALGKTISINKMMKGFRRLCLVLKIGSRITREAADKIEIFVESVIKD